MSVRNGHYGRVAKGYRPDLVWVAVEEARRARARRRVVKACAAALVLAWTAVLLLIVW